MGYDRFGKPICTVHCFKIFCFVQLGDFTLWDKWDESTNQSANHDSFFGKYFFRFVIRDSLRLLQNFRFASPIRDSNRANRFFDSNHAKRITWFAHLCNLVACGTVTLSIRPNGRSEQVSIMQKPELHILVFFIWVEQWRFQPPLPPAPTKLINQQPPLQTYAWRISYDWNTCYNDLENVHNLYII